MKKIFAALTVTFLLTTPSWAGQYAEAKQVMKKIVAVWAGLADALDKANDPATVVAALDEMRERMAEHFPRWHEIEKRHPELRTMDPVPGELREEVEGLKKQSERLGAHFKKLEERYGDNEDVKKAIRRLDEIMK